MNESRDSAVSTEYVDLSVVGMLRVIRQHWIMFLAVLLVCTSASVTYAFLATPIYKSSTLITPVSGETGGGGIGRLLQSIGGGALGGMGIRAARTSRAVGLTALSSPYFTRAFIKENNLLPVLFYDVWDADNNEWIFDDPEDIPTLQEGYELFTDDVLSVNEDDLRGLVEVVIEWHDPDLAADLANNLVASVNGRLRKQAISEADLTIEYLTEELSKTTAIQLQQSLYFLIESEIEKRTIAKVQKQYSFRVVSPATPSDADKWETPNRLFLISVGIAAGLFIGILIAFLLNPTKRVLRDSR
jgi:capsular polysaccharide biosynthesis protein